MRTAPPMPPRMVPWQSSSQPVLTCPMTTAFEVLNILKTYETHRIDEGFSTLSTRSGFGKDPLEFVLVDAVNDQQVLDFEFL